MVAALETKDIPLSADNDTTFTDLDYNLTSVSTPLFLFNNDEDLATRVIYVTFLSLGLVGNVILLIAVAKSQRFTMINFCFD